MGLSFFFRFFHLWMKTKKKGVELLYHNEKGGETNSLQLFQAKI